MADGLMGSQYDQSLQVRPPQIYQYLPIYLSNLNYLAIFTSLSIEVFIS